MAPNFQTAGSHGAQDRCADLVRRWLPACHDDACFWRHEALTEFGDEQLADACIATWGLDQPQGDENDLTWFEAHDADRTMLVTAFAAMRAAMRYDFVKAI